MKKETKKQKKTSKTKKPSKKSLVEVLNDSEVKTLNNSDSENKTEPVKKERKKRGPMPLEERPRHAAKNPHRRKFFTDEQREHARRIGKEGGRPNLMNEINLDKFCELLMVGCSSEQIAVALDIPKVRVEHFKKTERFKLAYQHIETYAIAQLKRKLFHRAVGYSHPEEKIFCNNEGYVTRVRTIKHYPPDTKALAMALHNLDKNFKFPSSNSSDTNINNTINNVIQNNKVKPDDITDEHRTRIERNLRIIRRHGDVSSEVCEGAD